MSSSAGHRRLTCHVLDFFYDDSCSCALTVLQNGVRFHVIADHKNFDDEDEAGSTGRSSREYNRLIKALKEKDEQEQAATDGKSNSSNASTSKDSGVDMTVLKPASTGLRKGGFEMDSTDVEQELQNWLLSPFGETFTELAPIDKKPSRPSVHEWYNGPTHFFDVKLDENGELSAMELEGGEDLEERMQNLMPVIDIPKYIRHMAVPHYSAHDLTVIGEAADPTPYHPNIVEAKDDTVYFLKLVDNDQPQPTKREIKLLKRIEDIGLRNSINVPQVLGLVYPNKGAEKIIGFLQTNIVNPTPLVKYLDEDISQRKRDKWATEVEQTKQLLHDNDIVFGDMKADNFLVDEDDRLWIIDFGGSYTAGWVDPEFMETEEGDDMGAEKIVNALHDPVNNTQDTFPRRPDEADDLPAKRKRSATDESQGDVEEGDASGDMVDKKRRHSEADVETFCFCDGPESGRMVACDGKDCARRWFHFECVDLEESPPKGQRWVCDECRGEWPPNG